MAGHNKWSKVKHIKARVDAIKGRVFSRCSREITLAARNGGGDPAMNPRLRAAIDNAKAVSMPRDNIERAIKKGTGELAGTSIQEITYEAYGPSGAAFLIEIATDNVNRTAAELRSILSKNNGTIATPGSVAYQFDRRGEVLVKAEEITEEKMMEAAIEAGAEDVRSDDEDEHQVLTAPTDLAAVAASLRDAGLPVSSEKLISLPQNITMIGDPAVARQAIRLFEALDEYQDTINVFTNFEVDDDILDQLED